MRTFSLHHRLSRIAWRWWKGSCKACNVRKRTSSNRVGTPAAWESLRRHKPCPNFRIRSPSQPTFCACWMNFGFRSLRRSATLESRPINSVHELVVVRRRLQSCSRLLQTGLQLRPTTLPARDLPGDAFPMRVHTLQRLTGRHLSGQRIQCDLAAVQPPQRGHLDFRHCHHMRSLHDQRGWLRRAPLPRLHWRCILRNTRCVCGDKLRSAETRRSGDLRKHKHELHRRPLCRQEEALAPLLTLASQKVRSCLSRTRHPRLPLKPPALGLAFCHHRR
mmetsp:Transcript_48787/g.109519  ORF Transcript_48787/g.109519 Transcript_48787/m.109519 type:complete len:276 (+) Transcript_48787:287-1114(+)